MEPHGSGVGVQFGGCDRNAGSNRIVRYFFSRYFFQRHVEYNDNLAIIGVRRHTFVEGKPGNQLNSSFGNGRKFSIPQCIGNGFERETVIARNPHIELLDQDFVGTGGMIIYAETTKKSIPFGQIMRILHRIGKREMKPQKIPSVGNRY